MSAMECNSFGPDFNFEKDSWNFDEGGIWRYELNVNNAWGYGSHNAFFTPPSLLGCRRYSYPVRCLRLNEG